MFNLTQPNPDTPVLSGRFVQFRLGDHCDTGCTCGESKAHVVARRHTFDGTLLEEFWNDGMVTCGAMRMVVLLSGLTPESLCKVAGDVEFYDLCEVRAFARKVRVACLLARSRGHA